jgi:hypothetical protein
MGMRSTYRCDAIFVLLGVGIRLARKMGLHRDGSSLGLSPFESEMRRRVWWYFVHTDLKIADLLSTRPSMDLFLCDTKMPLNVLDDDLSPDLKTDPPERTKITPIVVCLIRCELIEFLRKFSPISSNDIRWEVLGSDSISTEQKDALLDQLEDLLERKYLRYCDPAEPLHTMCSIMVRSAVAKMKLFAHHPRRYADKGIKIPQSERELVFTNAVKLLELASLVPGNPGLEKYMWQINPSYLWNTLLYVLIEARHRKIGPEVDKVWRLISSAYSMFPQIFDSENGGAMYSALRKWTIEVWDDYVCAMKAANLPEPAAPRYISAIRNLLVPPPCERNNAMVLNSNDQTEVLDSKSGFPAAQHDPAQARSHDVNPSYSFDPLEQCDFSDLLAFEANPGEWIQWDQLIAEEVGLRSVYGT